MDRDTIILVYVLLATIGALRVLKVIGKVIKAFLNHVLPDEPQDNNSKVRDSKETIQNKDTQKRT